MQFQINRAEAVKLDSSRRRRENTTSGAIHVLLPLEIKQKSHKRGSDVNSGVFTGSDKHKQNCEQAVCEEIKHRRKTRPRCIVSRLQNIIRRQELQVCIHLNVELYDAQFIVMWQSHWQFETRVSRAAFHRSWQVGHCLAVGFVLFTI